MIKIIDVLKTIPEGQVITVQGWIKTFRGNRFIALNDGSTINNLQCVIDYVNLTPVAIRQGHFLAEKLFNNKKTIEYDFANIPTAVFTSPQIGTVGLTLEMAKKNKIDAYELTTNFKSMKKTFLTKEKDTFYKIVINKKDRTIIGIHIISDDAAELIQLLAINVVAGNTLDEFKKTVAVHPTSTEELITI